MNPLQTVRVALRALLRNKMRSFLTMLGIIIGVFAVIALVAVGEGAKASVQKSLESMGSNLLVLRPGSSSRGGVFGGFGSQPTLTWDDLRAIREEIPSVRGAAAALRTNAQVMSEDQNWTTSVYGTSHEYLDLRNWKLALGESLSQEDVDTGAKVAVLGQTVVEKLYGTSADPVGQSIRIGHVPFTIVGVLEGKGQSGGGFDNDDAIYIPQTTYQSKISGGLQKFIHGSITIGAVSGDAVATAEQQIRELLRDRHNIPPGGDDDFSIRNLAEMAQAVESSTASLTMLLAAIAAVSLLVGGIGIMNIMLVSVTERTREIGVRMAVGAKPRQILAQFLVESLALSVAGGLIGIALGLIAARTLALQAGWPFVVQPGIIAVAVGFSGLVGVVFGLYPAFKASRLDPIEALRYE